MKSESVVPLEVPPPATGAPIPTVIANDRRMSFAYYVERVAADASNVIAIVRCKGFVVHTFGTPDENSILGHRLFRPGLEAVFEGGRSTAEVLHSEWIAELQRTVQRCVAVYPEVWVSQACPNYSTKRHFIFPFEDSTLEFVADDLEVELSEEALRDVVHRLIDEL